VRWRTEVRRRHVALLVARGRSEDAVEVLLALGDHDEAWRHAVDALPLIVERMDLALAGRWLDALDAVRRPPVTRVSVVVLRVAFGLEQYRRGAALWDAHGLGWVHDLVREDALEPVVLLVWCLWHLGRLSEADVVAATLPGSGWHRRVAETVLALSEDDPPPFPEVDPHRPGPLEGMLLRVAYSRGRLGWLREAKGQGGPWREVQGAPWRIAALRAAGRLDEALAEWELRRGTVQPLWLEALDGVELLLDAGRDDEAREALARGHDRARASGSQIYRILVQLLETRAHLRAHDLGAARRALSRADALGAHAHAFTRDLAALCHGAILLRENRAEAAEATLARCVERMRRGDRLLELPAAACYLAEAQARRGGEAALAEAVESSALALRVADERGSEALLLAALIDVPDVAIRAAAAAPAGDPRWRVLADRVTAGGARPVRAGAPRVVLEEFGRPVLRVDGRLVALRRRKEIELLAFLVSRPDRTARREEILDALFFGREDRASASYLRQCLHRVRALLPEGVDLERDDHLLRLVPRDAVAGTSGDLTTTARPAELHAWGRRGLLLSALEAADRGVFLDGISGPWVDDRRREVADLVARRRLEAASLSTDAGDVAAAERQIDRVLADDPYREQAWRVRLTLDGANGDPDRLLEHYQSYLAVMHDLGMGPSAEMHRLVETIRADSRARRQLAGADSWRWERNSRP
jgi:DNA-binding SARP family transcriptional activator